MGSQELGDAFRELGRLPRVDAKPLELTTALLGTWPLIFAVAMISLFLAARTGIDGFDLWKRLTLPSCVIVDPDAWAIRATLR